VNEYFNYILCVTTVIIFVALRSTMFLHSTMLQNSTEAKFLTIYCTTFRLGVNDAYNVNRY